MRFFMEKELKREETLNAQPVPDNAPHETEPDMNEDIPAESSDKIETITEETCEAPETELSEDDAEVQPEKPSFLKRMADALPDFIDRTGIYDNFITRLLGVYLIISGVNLLSLRTDIPNPVEMWKEYIGSVDTGLTALLVLAGFIGLSVLHFISPPKLRVLDTFAMFAGTVFFSCAIMWRNENFYMCIGAMLISVVFMFYLAGKTKNEHFEKIPDWLAGIMVFTIAALVCGFVMATTISHHKAFGTSCFDMGIFVQMFDSMITDFNMETSCERDVIMSHLNVHMSFIYWLLAPIYAIFPSGTTLIAAQAILAMGGVIPLFLIAKNHNYKGFALVAVCLIYVFYPGLIGPNYYDFHENAFLPTILMWLLYAVDRRKYVLFYVMGALTCMVKEDAPLYVICIGLYLLISEKSWKRIHGVIAAAVSGVYFVIITNWLSEHGDGDHMMATRFANLTIDPESGFIGIVGNVLTNPAYLVSLLVRETTFLNIVQVLAPLLFLPFMTKKLHRFLLLIPYIVMNLIIASHYVYASTVHYQYIFGTSCLLIYLLVLNCGDMSFEKRNMAVTGSMMACLLVSVCLFTKNVGYIENYVENKAAHQEIAECLAAIPEDAVVCSNTWYLPHIADRDEIYIFDHADLDIDEGNQVLLGVREPWKYDFYVFCITDQYMPEVAAKLEAEGFSLYGEAADKLRIYVSPYYMY